MYTFLLYTHSWLRWAVLIAGFVLIALSLTSWMSNRPYAKKDNILSASYTGLLHLQLLIGLLLYIVYSPYTQSAFEDFGAAMKDASLRFWAVEHIALMILAVIAAQIGRSRSKKQPPVTKHKTVAIFAIISMVLILAGIPWAEAARLIRL